MSLFNKYVSVFEDAHDPVTLQYGIDIMNIYGNYIIESIDYSVYETADNEVKSKNKKFSEFITDIYKRIESLITDLCTMIKDVFSPTKHITIDDYKNSELGYIQTKIDYAKIQDKVNDEIRQGRKIIQSLSKGTGIDDKTIEKYVDVSASIIDEYTVPTVITLSSLKRMKNTDKKLESLKGQMASAANDAASIIDPEKQTLARRVYLKMSHHLGELSRATNMFSNEVHSYNERVKKQ